MSMRTARGAVRKQNTAARRSQPPTDTNTVAVRSRRRDPVAAAPSVDMTKNDNKSIDKETVTTTKELLKSPLARVRICLGLSF